MNYLFIIQNTQVGHRTISISFHRTSAQDKSSVPVFVCLFFETKSFFFRGMSAKRMIAQSARHHLFFQGCSNLLFNVTLLWGGMIWLIKAQRGSLYLNLVSGVQQQCWQREKQVCSALIYLPVEHCWKISGESILEKFQCFFCHFKYTQYGKPFFVFLACSSAQTFPFLVGFLVTSWRILCLNAAVLNSLIWPYSYQRISWNPNPLQELLFWNLVFTWDHTM